MATCSQLPSGRLTSTNGSPGAPNDQSCAACARRGRGSAGEADRPAPPRAGFGGSCGPRRRSSARPSPPSSPNDHAPARRLPIDRSASAPGPRPGILDEAVGRAEMLIGRGPFQLTVQQPRRKAAGLVDDLAQPALRPGPGPAGEDLQPFPYRGHLRLGGSHSARSISSAVTAMLSGTSCVGDQKSGRRARATRCPRRCNATPPLSAAFFPAQMPVATSRWSPSTGPRYGTTTCGMGSLPPGLPGLAKGHPRPARHPELRHGGHPDLARDPRERWFCYRRASVVARSTSYAGPSTLWSLSASSCASWPWRWSSRPAASSTEATASA